MDLTDPVNITAISTAVYAGLTLLVLLESRLTRRAMADTANVHARMTLSHGGDIEDVVYLENAGPAIATDVALRVQYLNEQGNATGRKGSFAVALFAPGDRYPLLVSALLRSDASREMLPQVDDLAERRLKINLSWSWRDNRRSLPWIFSKAMHRGEVEVDFESYRASIHGGILMVEPDVFTELRDLRNDLKRARFEDEARRGWRKNPPPPEVQAEIEARQLQQSVEVWRARIAYARRWLRQALIRRPRP